MPTIRPQEGFQYDFTVSRADILIGGSAAGVGKTFALLIDPLRHVHNKDWGAVIFRRTSPQIKAEGGLWDASNKIYNHLGAKPRESTTEWVFPSGCRFKFSHLEYEKNIYDWQGSEVPYIAFDELTHFNKKMFFYLLSRNRSTCGVSPRMRATCNPDPDSFLVTGKDGWGSGLISWWIGEDGYPIKERSGVVRYVFIDGEDYIFGDTFEEVYKTKKSDIDEIVESSKGLVKPEHLIKSISFIAGSIYDNKELLKVNPQYLANLLAQGSEEKAILFDGNWKVRIDENDLIDYEKFLDSFDDSYLADPDDRYIAADIAMQGSDKMIIGYFEGDCLMDLRVVDKSDGKDVIRHIDDFQKKYKVKSNRVVFDADGVGAFVSGYIKGAYEFKNGLTALNKENYKNLKTQCYYKLADCINSENFEVSERVANMRYGSSTVKNRMLQERKAIKKFKKDHDGKLQINDKSDQKKKLKGSSPDILDMCAMKQVFKLLKKATLIPGLAFTTRL